jgi:hypothetical protein
MASPAQGAVLAALLITVLPAAFLCRIPDSTSALYFNPASLALVYIGGSTAIGGCVSLLCCRVMSNESVNIPY